MALGERIETVVLDVLEALTVTKCIAILTRDKVISNKEHPKAKLVLGVPSGSAKHQLGEVIVRDFLDIISVLVVSLLEIT